MYVCKIMLYRKLLYSKLYRQCCTRNAVEYKYCTDNAVQDMLHRKMFYSEIFYRKRLYRQLLYRKSLYGNCRCVMIIGFQ